MEGTPALEAGTSYLLVRRRKWEEQLHVRQEIVPKKELVNMVVRCKLTPPPHGGEVKTYTTTTWW